jgi:thiopeptide-type bacteriocin biosynthesis protein
MSAHVVDAHRPSVRTADAETPEVIVPAGFFAMRTPLLPFDELTRWSGEPATNRGDARARAAEQRTQLRRIVDRPEVRDALFLASPSLDESLPIWFDAAESERGQKVERALVRYVTRMAARPTPFGLFGGVSHGRIGATSCFELPPMAAGLRRTRLDMDYLFALAERLAQEPALAETLRYRPNSSIYRSAGRVRYIEANVDERMRAYQLVAVDDSEPLRGALAAADVAATRAEIVAALQTTFGGDLSIRQLRAFVDELIRSQLLVPELLPAVTGDEPLPILIEQLRRTAAESTTARQLEGTRRLLDDLDAAGVGLAPARYRALADGLSMLPVPVALPRLFQVDLFKPAPALCLGQAPLAELLATVRFLSTLQTASDPLARFRERFTRRYEDAEVPLLEALDEESGVGVPASAAVSAETSPLLAGLAFEPSPSDEPRFAPCHAHLTRRLDALLAAGGTELVLDDEDARMMAVADPVALPDSFAVVVTISASSAEAVDAGQFKLVVGATSGPSGARVLGRFCHGDRALADDVRAYLRAEEELRPDALFAEIVHLPEARAGNVLLRPILRSWELPFLGRSGAPRDRQIAADDLMVSVRDGRLMLRSRQLGREIIPRLTTAHNYGRQALGVYRFLCSLQMQGVSSGLAWDWGPLTAHVFLPRVVYGRSVLARARWQLQPAQLAALAAARSAADRFDATQRLRAQARLPRHVVVEDGDNQLAVDLDNPLSVETFSHLVRGRASAVLTELYPGPAELCVHGPEGRFVHELVVPFIRRHQQAANRERRTVEPHPRPLKRRFPPGSEWLYARLYTGKAGADELLRNVVRPLVRDLFTRGAVDRWFFLRFDDPEWHVRLRFHGEPHRLAAEVLPLLHERAAEPLERGALWKLQLDTYEREVERFGGTHGIGIAEAYFHADSAAVLDLVTLYPGTADADARWRLALSGIDRLLVDLGLDLSARAAIVAQLRAGLAREHRAGTQLDRQLGAKFRDERLALEALLDTSTTPPVALAPGVRVLERRSEQLAPIFAELQSRDRTRQLNQPLPQLAASYVHLHVNRLLRATHRTHELVLYDFLARLYRGRIARRA